MAAATESDAPDVLKQLDERSPGRFYWSLTLLATLGGFLFGYDTANIGFALNLVPYKLGDFATGYLVAGASLGAAVRAFCAGPIADRFGRRSLLIVPWISQPVPPTPTAKDAMNASSPIIATTMRGMPVNNPIPIAAMIAEMTMPA